MVDVGELVQRWRGWLKVWDPSRMPGPDSGVGFTMPDDPSDPAAMAAAIEQGRRDTAAMHVEAVQLTQQGADLSRAAADACARASVADGALRELARQLGHAAGAAGFPSADTAVRAALGAVRGALEEVDRLQAVACANAKSGKRAPGATLDARAVALAKKWIGEGRKWQLEDLARELETYSSSLIGKREDGRPRCPMFLTVWDAAGRLPGGAERGRRVERRQRRTD